MGTHNGARFIDEQVLSILHQTRPIDEIVVSDDASTDGTVERIEQLVEGHRTAGAPAPTLVVKRTSTALGVTANFEQALRAASGDLVLLCDVKTGCCAIMRCDAMVPYAIPSCTAYWLASGPRLKNILNTN